MAVLEEVLSYFNQLNQCVDAINQVDDYAAATQPLVMRMVAAGETDTSFGRAAGYIVAINETLTNIYNADQYQSNPKVMDAYVRRQFQMYNVEIDSLANYFNTHWWQFAGAKGRAAIATLPPISYFNAD